MGSVYTPHQKTRGYLNINPRTILHDLHNLISEITYIELDSYRHKERDPHLFSSIVDLKSYNNFLKSYQDQNLTNIGSEFKNSF